MGPGDGYPAWVGPYRLNTHLGAGGMSQVFSGEHRLLGRQVAVKLRFRTPRADEALRVERFRNGARLQSELRHKAIAPVYDFVESETYQAIIMEMLHGGTVEELLRAKGGPLPPAEALDIAVRVSEAMEFAHRLGVIHRDLKPANILFAKPGRTDTVRVSDFGVAKAPDRSPDLTVAGANVGTLWYMPPEQLSHAHIGADSDVYSIGATLFEMLTGHVPFARLDASEVFKRFLDDAPLPSFLEENLSVPASLRDVVYACLSIERQRRIRSAGALAALLRGIARLEGLNLSLSDNEERMVAQRDEDIQHAMRLLDPGTRSALKTALRDTETESGSPTQSIPAIDLRVEPLETRKEDVEDARVSEPMTLRESRYTLFGPDSGKTKVQDQFDDDDDRTIVSQTPDGD